MNPHRAKGKCSTHYNQSAGYSKGTYVWNDSRRDAYHRRRAVMFGERVLRADVAARDGYICRLCFEPVDMALMYPDRLSASLDHTIPLSRGGAHDLGNVVLAHLACNRGKGVQILESA